MAHVKELTDQTFGDSVLKAPGAVLVDFFSPT